MARSPSTTREPTLDEPLDPITASDRGASSGARAPAPEPVPGLFEQVGSTRDAAKRLVGAHVELAKAEAGDIADAVKRALILGGVAIAAALFAGLLIGVGTPLWLGEWLFGSMGWGILLGLLLLAAVATVAITLALRPAVDARVGPSFLVAAVIGIVVGVIFGLDLTNRGWTLLADNVAGNLAADSRPLVVAVIALAVVGGILGLVLGLVRGLGAAAIGSLLAGAIGGVLLGLLTAAAPGPRVGAAIGVAAGLIAWMALMGMAVARGGFETDKLKDRFWPARTIEVTKETIEWARERMPLMRRS